MIKFFPESQAKKKPIIRCFFLASLLCVFFVFGSSSLFAYQVGGGNEGRDGCYRYSVKVCVVDECGHPLILPSERLSQLNVVVNDFRKAPSLVSPPDENGCVTIVYYPSFRARITRIRVVWSFQLNSCPEGEPNCDPTSEAYVFGEDNEVIYRPQCNESALMTLSNYTKRNQFYLRTDDCVRKVLNGTNHTEEICSDDPTLFLEVNQCFLGVYKMKFEIIDNQTDDNGNNPVLENRVIPCFSGTPVGQPGVNGLMGIGSFDCGVDEEGSPITESEFGIDLTNYLSADATCEKPSNITLNISLYCCGETESFVDLSYTFIWQPDVTLPDPLFYFSTENNTVEAFNDGTKYDNGIADDDLLINADSDPNSYTGNGPILGRLSLGLNFLEEISNFACWEKFTVEFFEFPQCDMVDWANATPMTYDHDNNPATPERSVIDVTEEVTENGYSVSVFDLPADSIGHPFITFDISSCYYVKAEIHNKCGDIFEEYGRFNTASCNFCRLVQEEAPPLEAKVYPSIVQDQINIQLSRKSNSETEVSIFDVSGRPIEQRVFDVNNTQLEINSLNAPSGMYFIQIKSGDFEKVSKIFIQK